MAGATVCGWAWPMGTSADRLRIALALALTGCSFIAGRDRLLRAFDRVTQYGFFQDLGLLPDLRRDLTHDKAEQQQRLLKAALVDLKDAKVRIRLLEARLALRTGGKTQSPSPASSPAPPPTAPPAPAPAPTTRASPLPSPRSSPPPPRASPLLSPRSTHPGTSPATEPGAEVVEAEEDRGLETTRASPPGSPIAPSPPNSHPGTSPAMEPGAEI
ncbi:hypothetical protein OC844_007875, partial [Tilletia horrida]